MINPSLMHPRQLRKSTTQGGKVYCAILILGNAYFTLRADYTASQTDPLAKQGLHSTASSAIARAERVKARWKRLYSAAILAQVTTGESE